MRNPLRAILILALTLTAAACARPATPRPTPASAEGAALVRRCAPQGGLAARSCYESAFLDVLRNSGARSALQAIGEAASLDADLQREAHIHAHAVGIASFTSPEEVGQVFARCTAEFQSGCYHGVIQAYFLDAARAGAPLDSARLNALCRDYRGEGGAEADHWLGFQCAHGIGHGLVMTSEQNLPRALEGCDLLASGWEREACYGGAFMENIVAATDPHHGPAAHAAHEAPGAAAPAGHSHGEHSPDEHAGHAMGPSGADHAQHAAAFPPLDPADPHHPCSAVGERYQSACYLMQTSVVLQHTNGDFSAARSLCDTAPEFVRKVCYMSFGRDAASYGDQQTERIIALCRVASEPFRPWCHAGAAKNLIDRTADPTDGVRYCAAVAAAEGRERCFQAVGEQLYELERSPERRAELCRALPAGDVAACLRGADVAEEHPAT